MSKKLPAYKRFVFSIVFIFSFFILPLKAQQLKWASEGMGGYNQGQTVCAAPNGNVFVYGSFLDSVRLGTVRLNDTGSFYASGFIASYDKNGNTRWAFNLDYSVNQYIMGVAAGPYGDLYIYGNVGATAYPYSTSMQMNNFTAPAIRKGFIAKCDSSGHIKWIKQYPYINASGFAVSGNGHLHINGFFDSVVVQIGSKTLRKDTCIANQFLATLDSGGNTLSAAVVATYNYATANFSIVATDSLGDVFMHGTLHLGDSALVGADTFVTIVDSTEYDHNLIFKVTEQGNMVWSYEVSPVLYTMNMAADAKGDFYMGGSTQSSVYFSLNAYIDPKFYDTTSYLVRFDENGTPEWAQTYISSSKLNQFSATPYVSAGISVDNEGHIYAIGTTHDTSNSYFTILEFNSLGENMWVDTILAIRGPVLTELNSFISNISASGEGAVYFTGAFDTTCTFRIGKLPKPVYNNADSTAYFGDMFLGGIINKDTSRLGLKNAAPAASMAIKVFPNPASQSAAIQFTANTPSQYFISLTDLEGRQVYNSSYYANEGLNNYTLNLQNLSPGMYILNVQNGNGVQRVKVVVK